MAYESSIVVGGNKIVIDRPMRDFMAVYARFEEDIVTESRIFKELFEEKVKSYDDVLSTGFDLYMHSLSMFCKVNPVAFIVEAFEGSKIIGNEKYLFETMLEANAFPGVNAWGEFFKEINVLKDKYEQYQMSKASRPDTYGGFRGGGVGISGGLSGAIKASLLNLAVDAVAGSVNKAVDHKTLENIYNKMIALTNLIIKDDTYVKFMIEDCTKMKNMILDLLIDEGFLPNIKGYEVGVSTDTLHEILNNSKIDTEHREKAISDIGMLIMERPYELVLYDILCKIEPEYGYDVLNFLSQNKMREAFFMMIDPKYSKPLVKDGLIFTLD